MYGLNYMSVLWNVGNWIYKASLDRYSRITKNIYTILLVDGYLPPSFPFLAQIQVFEPKKDRLKIRYFFRILERNKRPILRFLHVSIL